MFPEDERQAPRATDAQPANDGAEPAPALVLLAPAEAANDTADEAEAALREDPEFLYVCEARRARWIEAMEAEAEEAERLAEG